MLRWFEYSLKKIEEWVDFNGKYSLEKKNSSGRKREKNEFLPFPHLAYPRHIFFFLVDSCLMLPYVCRLCRSAVSHLPLEPLCRKEITYSN